jgi:hypothetical protein
MGQEQRWCCEPESVITPLDRVLSRPADADGDVAANVTVSALVSMVLLIGDPWEPGGACQLSVELGRSVLEEHVRMGVAPARTMSFGGEAVPPAIAFMTRSRRSGRVAPPFSDVWRARRR